MIDFHAPDVKPPKVNIVSPKKDYNQKEAKYLHNVKKQDEKEKFEKIKLNRNPSGYMTTEEYELLSVPQDRMKMEFDVPKTPTPADMYYVPKPSYKIVKYNNPPGSPELTIYPSLYKNFQQNSQGIVSPDFKRLVYPSIYYYPNSGSTACDVFVIMLDDAQTNKDKILTANTAHRLPEPILSTDKDNYNYYMFRTITPVDFSADGTKILLKEKVGNTRDGMWKTTPFVYDFETETLYDLKAIREAVTYYWRGLKDLNLGDKRWDIYPLGFSQENPDWIVVNAYAYTGEVPVNLGTWTINSLGETPRIISTGDADVNISMNGYKLVKDGVEPPMITKKEEKQLKHVEKAVAKQKKAEDKAEVKELTKSYKAKIKEINTEFKESQADYKLRQKIEGSTEGTDIVERYNEIKKQNAIKKQQQLEKQKAREQKRIERHKQKEQRALEKAKNKNNQETEEETPVEVPNNEPV